MLRKLFQTLRNGDVAEQSSAQLPALSLHDPGPVVQEAAKHAAAGRHTEALHLIDASLPHGRNDPMLMFARGSTLFHLGRYREARMCLVDATEHGLEDPVLFLQAGWSSIWTVGPQSGEEWMLKAVALDPNNWLGHFGLGSSLHGQERMDEAVVCLERGLALSPDNVECLTLLFDCRRSQKRFTEAEAYARRAIAAEDHTPRGWINLGVALISQDRFHEACAAFERADALEANGDGDQHLNLGICLRETGRTQEALALYERKLPALASVGAHAHYGHALLTAGRLREGWSHYEFRWMQEPLLSLRARFGKPVWAGQELRGRTVLLRCEQGVGDVIQFIRYAPHVAALGAIVVLQLRKNIGELARSFPGVHRIVNPGETVPDFDFYIHLMSLPRVFGTDLETIPAQVPYLLPDPGRINRWKERLHDDGKLKVGLVWAGDPSHLRDRYRSVPFSLLAPLANMAGVRCFSLQKGPQAGQIKFAATDIASIVDLGAEMHDFADTAAIIAELDLLICVDTSVAHLAGALGKPVWVLVPTPADWRWLEGREDSPWYPTMRLFRQKWQGRWEDVIERVQIALDAVVQRREAPGTKHTLKISDPLAPLSTSCALSAAALGAGPSAVAETRVGILQYWPDEEPVGPSIERYGEYLQDELDALARWIAPGATVLVAGAGVGIHALFLAAEIGPTGHLLLYEDDPLHRQVLQQNLKVNGAANFTLMKHPLARHRTAEDAAHVLAGSRMADGQTIDDLHLESLDWVKVNEGVDALGILEGAADTLWRLRPMLFLAAGGEDMLDELVASVRAAGYAAFRMETPLFRSDNFNRSTKDMFHGKTALALLAVPEETEIDVSLERCVKL
jgi:tetratricopeptide (TPR) repeat protein